MPHLSPMNWISAMILLWILLLMISASSWWSQPISFKSTNMQTNKPQPSKLTWKWL